MNKDILKQQVKMSAVLEKYYGIPISDNKQIIPCPIHGGDGQNFQYDDDKGIATCYSQCGKTWDIFALVKETFNINFSEAVEKLKTDFLVGEVYETIGDVPEQKKAPLEAGTSNSATKNYTSFFNSLTQDDYFNQRGISSEIIEKYNLGTVETETNMNQFDRKEKYVLGINRFIIPISDSFFIARLDPSKTSDPENAAKYRNFGKSQLLNGHYIVDDCEKPIFVTEGAIDALSIETLGHKAIALNSVSGANKLVQAIQSNEAAAKEKQFILLADNDKAGKQLEEKLKKELKQMYIDIFIGSIPPQYKDINEILISDKKHAAKILDNLTDKIMNHNSAFNVLTNFFTDIKKVDPVPISNFPELNMVLGGLRSGLYVVGGASSLGKTTFVQNIVDTIAANGQDVLFISLEMGEKELVAKSLVKTMREITPEGIEKFGSLPIGSGEVHDAVINPSADITSTRDLLNGNIKNMNLVRDAIAHYEDTAKNIFIEEGLFDFTIEKVRVAVEKHVKKHGTKPVIVIDYLQILQPLDMRMSEKQATDRNISELKRMSREFDIPVIVISSFNRSSYGEESSFKSFKESGSIEYGADVIIGLHLKKDEDDTRDETELRSKPMRAIEAAILKNRFGNLGKIQYSYWTKYNLFLENVPTIMEEKKKEKVVRL